MVNFDDLQFEKTEDKRLGDGALAATFRFTHLPRGFGHTLGVMLRRTLLAYIEGYAVVTVRINDLDHEYATIPGVLENVLDIILRIQKIRFNVSGSDDRYVIRLYSKGEGVVKAGDFDMPSGIMVVNKELIIATLTDKKAELAIEAEVARGIGFKVARDEIRNTDVGLIPLDAVFSPVRLVRYEVEPEPSRRDEQLKTESLVITIETDGGVTPIEALSQALHVLNNFTSVVAALGSGDSVKGENSDTTQQAAGGIEDLGLSAGIVKKLKNAGIETVDQLLKLDDKELEAIPGIGKAAVKAIKDAVA